MRNLSQVAAFHTTYMFILLPTCRKLCHLTYFYVALTEFDNVYREKVDTASNLKNNYYPLTSE